jgi:hypothetical protein
MWTGGPLVQNAFTLQFQSLTLPLFTGLRDRCLPDNCVRILGLGLPFGRLIFY